MELKTYLAVILRRAWVVAGVFILALAASAAGLVLVPQAISYQAKVSLAVRPLPEPKTGSYYTYDEYYPYLASEYLNDDVIKLVEGAQFMRDLQDRLKTRYAAPPSGSIKGEKAHRVLTITVTSGTADGALALAQAAVEALSDKSEAGKSYWDELTAKEVAVAVLDPPAITSGPGTRSLLDLALRGLVGLLAGLALAFLLDYLDDSVRDAAEVEQLLGIPTLGEIPAERGARPRAAARPRAPVGA